MASPQLENGYTQLSNELLEKILEYPFRGYELKIILKIIRDTYGWNAKKRQISFGKMAEKTGIDRVNVIHTTTSLTSRNILFIQKLKNNKNLWGINKNYEEWLAPDGSPFQEYEFQQQVEKNQAKWKSTWTKNKFPPLTEILEQEINKILKDYGEEKFIEALKISVKQNNKKLAYIEGILKRQRSGNTGDATGKTQISDGRWMTDEELADAEMRGEIIYNRDSNSWIVKPK